MPRVPGCPRVTIRRLTACLLLGLCALGCGRIERTRQCVRVVTTVNQALDEIAERQDAGIGNADGERQLAERYAKLAADLAAAPLDSPPLLKAVTEYRELLLDTSRLLQRLADARQRKERVAIALNQRELASIGRRDKMLVMRIDALCQSP
jgi:hypothetical protein